MLQPTDPWEGHTGQEVEDYLQARLAAADNAASDNAAAIVAHTARLNSLAMRADAGDDTLEQTASDIDHLQATKVGYTLIAADTEANTNTLLGFADEEAAEAWQATPEADRWSSPLILTRATLPSIEGADVYTTTLTLREQPDYLQATTEVNVYLRAVRTYIPAGGTAEQLAGSVTIEVQRRTATGDYTTAGTFAIQADTAAEPTYQLGKLTPYLAATGETTLRLRARTEEAVSVWREITIRVAALSIADASDFTRPLLPTDTALHLRYYLTGDIDKYLRLEVGTLAADGRYTARHTYINTTELSSLSTLGQGFHIGTDVYPLTPYELDIPAAALTGIAAGAVFEVRAWLYATDSVQTAPVATRFMRATDSSVLLATADHATTAENYTDTTLLSYAAYDAANPEAPVPVTFLLEDADGALLASWTRTAAPLISAGLAVQLAFEVSDTTPDTIAATLRAIHAETGTQLMPPLPIALAANRSLAPVSGATFIIAPASRSNTEHDPATIVNAATGLAVDATFTGFDFKADGWRSVGRTTTEPLTAAEAISALHIPAGRRVVVDFNPLRQLYNADPTKAALAGRSLTLELDFRATNITDDTEPVIQLAENLADGLPQGLVVLPTEALLLTRDRRNRDDQNTAFAEDTRTRLTINILYQHAPEPGSEVRMNYARLFINDTCEREFFYQATDSFTPTAATPLILGSDTADLTLFGLRLYEDRQLSTADIMRDYRAALPTTAEKLAWQEANDITGAAGTIDLDKAIQAGYNVVAHTGQLPTYGDLNKGKDKAKGVSLFLHFPAEDISGTLHGVDGQGQGTTAMTYYYWNQQYKLSSRTTFTPSEYLPTSDPLSGGALRFAGCLAKKLCGKINFASSMQGHKMGLCRAYDELYRQIVTTGYLSRPAQVEAFTTAHLAVQQRPAFFFHRQTEQDPYEFQCLMTFGAGKGDAATFGYSDTETPRMLMVEGADNDVPLALFAAPWDDSVSYDAEAEAWKIGTTKQINFGFGHTDADGKPDNAEALEAVRTFFNYVYLHSLNLHPYRGTASQLLQGQPLAINPVAPDPTADLNTPQEQATYLSAATALAGATSEHYTPTPTEQGAPSRARLYYVLADDASESSHAYDLYRYDTAAAKWVPAGVDGARLNIVEQLQQLQADLYATRTEPESAAARTACTAALTACTDTTATEADTAAAIRTARAAHFRATAATRLHVGDALYHQAFIKFFACTDNRAKNTYYYTDPEDLRIRFFQDDLDTSLRTNNVGQQRKPYYVEEHDTDAARAYYWQGVDCALYTLLEQAFAEELRQMMRRLLAAMTSLAGTPTAYLQDVVLEAQHTFPATAYNENARLVYERAAVAQNTPTVDQQGNTGYRYQNGAAQAITQQCGTQREAETQWLSDRLQYLSSWCEYGEFQSGTEAAGALTWRGANGAYSFHLTPAKWLYPRVAQGSSNVRQSPYTTAPIRVPALASLDYTPLQLDADTQIFIRGVNNYADLGDFNHPTTEGIEFVLTGRRLRAFSLGAPTTQALQFRPATLTIGAPNLRTLDLRGATTLRGALDISTLTALETLDLRGTGITSVAFPEGNALREVHLPATLTTLAIHDRPALQTLTFEGYDALERLDVSGVPALPAADIIATLAARGRTLTYLQLGAVNLTGLSLAELRFLMQQAEAQAPEYAVPEEAFGDANEFRPHLLPARPIPAALAPLQGRLSLAASERPTLRDALRLQALFGTSYLQTTYTRVNIASVQLLGSGEIHTTGNAQPFLVRCLPYTANNLIAEGASALPLLFELVTEDTPANDYADEQPTTDYDTYLRVLSATTGLLKVTQLATSTGEDPILTNPALDDTTPETDYMPRPTLRLTLTTPAGAQLIDRRHLCLCRRAPRRFDFAYPDGTFDSLADISRGTPAGWVTETPTPQDDGTRTLNIAALTTTRTNAHYNDYGANHATTLNTWGVGIQLTAEVIAEVNAASGTQIPSSGNVQTLLGLAADGTDANARNALALADRLYAGWVTAQYDEADPDLFERLCDPDDPRYVQAAATYYTATRRDLVQWAKAEAGTPITTMAAFLNHLSAISVCAVMNAFARTDPDTGEPAPVSRTALASPGYNASYLTMPLFPAFRYCALFTPEGVDAAALSEPYQQGHWYLPPSEPLRRAFTTGQGLTAHALLQARRNATGATFQIALSEGAIKSSMSQYDSYCHAINATTATASVSTTKAGSTSYCALPFCTLRWS